MKLNNVDILELLPGWMREERDVQALSLGTNEVAREAYNESLLLTRWDKIDELGEDYLDTLAKELNVPWYRTDADIEVKRKIIKNSDLVHKILGTKKAVEMVVDDYFNEGEVREWFEYGGDPYHFRVVSENAESVKENAELFMALLEIVKRKSAWLDALAVLFDESASVYAGTVYHDIERIAVTFELEEDDE